ncbi:Arrestin (or S-antigen), N-terminal domain [Geosmithia morbida]|uniref:Arrestin (Or S-antigen), N-terminal domain n=1 Tax=Geosmithia morbida TaxID=1094350 RepID=A0A9P4YS27_9HYPO|nr:Arrestin (or S-antigen), N-terminal domain [Geosmithia morbida]KAF4121030.1 Arrestin (or S-antigen), N-terminal domain [Geosmithia morbida]
MSIRIALDNRPEFYTNLDHVSGTLVLSLTRPEQIGNIVVKLEGEAMTALQVPHPADNNSPGGLGMPRNGPPPGPPGSIVGETHKLLYKVQQVFPDEYYSSTSNPYGAYPLQPGEHEFPFKFRLPINNACSDPMAMSKIGGLGGRGGFGSGGGFLGMGGVRVMDGSKQLFLRHVTRTLPPSLTGFPMSAEIRYYIKVTVQRPGFLKENWRFQAGFKFMPIEPPRPKATGREAYARRPFTFQSHPGAPSQQQPSSSSSSSAEKKRSSFFGSKKDEDAKLPSSNPFSPASTAAPSVEISARLPHPSIVTCNKPVPLRLVAKKLVDSPAEVFLVSMQMELIGYTDVRCHNIYNRRVNRWVVVSDANLNIPLTTSPDDEVGKEVVVPDTLWAGCTLPNTIAPSFECCNLSRRYDLELKLGVAWGKPHVKTGIFSSSKDSHQPQVIILPLLFQNVEVFSGISPPPELVEAARNTRPGHATIDIEAGPRLPPRTNNAGASAGNPDRPAQPPRPQGQVHSQPPISDPLYPPQLAPGQVVPPRDDAPPSYDEAMAENLAGPFEGHQERPAYSGVTNENAPSQMPQEKN